MPILFLIGGIVLISVFSKRSRRHRKTSAKANQSNIKFDERSRLRVCADYNRRCKAEMERRQAQADIIHLKQRRADLLKAYELVPDDESERSIKKRIQYDNAIRQTDKAIEKAVYISRRTY